jgi:hypothetical protein
MMEGERRTRVYADVLEISDLPPKEQAQVVKRHKDRVKKTLQRNISRSGMSENG